MQITCFRRADWAIAFAPILLERKAARIQKELSQDPEKGPVREVRSRFDSADRDWKHIVKKALVRPFKLFYSEPIAQLLGAYMAFVYGLLYRVYFCRGCPSFFSHNILLVFLTTIPSIFEGVYKQRVGIAGLHYIALGVGLTGASQVNARVMDKIYVYFTKKNGGQGRPEYRLRESHPPSSCHRC